MNKFIKSLFTILALGITLSACDKNDGPNVNNETQEVSALMQNGTWRITSYKDDRRDLTSMFTDYTFTFGGSNQLTALLGTNTYTGTWSITVDDDGPNDLDFNIFFSNPNTLRELNEDWDIISRTESKIVLSDDDDDIEEDVLIFEKQ
ncbi:MAG: hypothetical protein ABW174_07910 [Flavitalea sp.]